MIGLGTIINVLAILVGGLLGLLFGKFFSDSFQDTIQKSCGLCSLFIGITGAVQGLLFLENGSLVSVNTLLIVICIPLGAAIGEIIGIEHYCDLLGEWLKEKSNNIGDSHFVDAFVTGSLTVAIGAMAVVGSIEDGVYGDYTILATKSTIDFFFIMILASSLGKGCIFSVIPVAIIQGGITILSKLIAPFITDAALSNLSLVGSILIFCIGINLIWGKKIAVANYLPAIFLAVFFSYF